MWITLLKTKKTSIAFGSLLNCNYKRIISSPELVSIKEHYNSNIFYMKMQ